MEARAQTLITGVRAGDTRSLARVVTLAENEDPQAREILSELFKFTGKAQIIGVTGAPGAGKSTLVDRLVRAWRKLGKRVAVLAVDPSSPFSGGAVLGDRIRMQSATEDPDVYVRSMATRGSLGGLARASFDAIQVLDAAGYDIIVVETVGVGQGEVDIVRTADTCLVLLVPGMGDGVQVLKAGIVEIADIFVINKADRAGAESLHKELRTLISLGEYAADAWKTEIVHTVASEGTGTDELVEYVDKHQQWLANSGAGKERRVAAIRQWLIRILNEQVTRRIVKDNTKNFEALVNKCYLRETDLYSAAEVLSQTILAANENAALSKL